jgi:putative ABC transport system permease protein
MRLTVQPVQELLALLGITAGVALVFAVLVANNSVSGSVRQLAHGLAGRATLEVAARDPRGMDQRVLDQIRGLRSVGLAAPIVQRRGGIVGPKGRQAVDLIGTNPALVSLGGSLLRNFRGVRLQNGVALPERVASAIGVRAGDFLVLQVGERARRVQVGTVLGADQIHALAQSPVAVAELAYAQELTGMQGRITRLLVAPAKGRARQLAGELRQVAGPGLDVRPSDSEARLVEQAAGPNDQSTAIFAAISAIVGALLAFNAMLLTMPERRRFVAMLRLQGFTRGGAIAVLAFDALVLGTVASLVGLLLGDLLSRSLFHAVPGYLQFAFAIGRQRIVSPQTVALAFGAGLVATLVAAARPAFDLYSRGPVDAVFMEHLQAPHHSSRVQRLSLIAGLALVGATTLVVQLAPRATIVGVGLLVLAMSLMIPALLAGLLRAVDALTYRLPRSGGLLGISVFELGATATRSIALIATAAIAVFGTVALEGSRRDLLRGLDQNFAGNLNTADLAVAPGGDENSLYSQPFQAPPLLSHPNAAIGVGAVRVFQAAVLDLRNRRVWVNARPPNERTLFAPGELVSGDPATATRELRAHGWAAVSTAIANEKSIHVGATFSLPTPAGTSTFKAAAIITNLGWPPGAIVINTADYKRAWGASDPTALELDVAQGVSVSAAKTAAQRALGPDSGLVVQTAAERQADARRIARQGLTRLTQISALVLIGAIAAAAAAIAAALWQRRPQLAALKAEGFESARLWRGLLVEIALLVTTGCVLGAAFGLYGQLLLTRWLRLTTGFPAPYSLAGPLALALLGLMAAITLTVTAIPGYLAARVSPSLSFHE